MKTPNLNDNPTPAVTSELITLYSGIDFLFLEFQIRLMNITRPSLVTLLVLLFSGCVPTVSSTRFDGAVTGAPSASVQVFTDASNIHRPYKEIGFIIADDHEAGAWGVSNEGSLIQKAIAKAKSMGADGIILLATQNDQRNIAYGGAANSVNRQVVRASAIVFTQ
jgi:hypothetical protein